MTFKLAWLTSTCLMGKKRERERLLAWNDFKRKEHGTIPSKLHQIYYEILIQPSNIRVALICINMHIMWLFHAFDISIHKAGSVSQLWNQMEHKAWTSWLFSILHFGGQSFLGTFRAAYIHSSELSFLSMNGRISRKPKSVSKKRLSHSDYWYISLLSKGRWATWWVCI